MLLTKGLVYSCLLNLFCYLRACGKVKPWQGKNKWMPVLPEVLTRLCNLYSSKAFFAACAVLIALPKSSSDGSRSMLMKAGLQEAFEHHIAKSTRPMKPRINLTFRIVKHGNY
jgi:hypothetical protein